MPQYILTCNHPRVEDTDPEPDEEYLEIVRDKETHAFSADNDNAAFKWVEEHQKEEVRCSNQMAHPRPLKLVRVLREW